MNDSDAPRDSRQSKLLLLLFLVMALVGSYLLFFAGSPASKPVRKVPPKVDSISTADSVAKPGKRPAFVELIYEHNFAPVTGGDIPSRASAKSLNGFFLDAKGTTLYSCTPGVAPVSTATLLVGRRVRNQYFTLHDNMFQELVNESDWDVATHPSPDDVLMFGPTFWLRLPVKVSVALQNDCCVVSGIGEAVTLAVGESKEIWSASRTFTPEEYATAVAEIVNGGRDEKIEMPERVLEGKLPLTDGKLTLHSRLVAIYQGPVNFSSLNPLAERDAGIAALRSGDFDDAITRFDACLTLLPSDDLLLNLHGQAQRGKDNQVTIHKLEGTISLPASEQIHPRSWIGIRRPDEPADHSHNISGVKNGAFAFNVESGSWVVTAYITGFKPISQLVDVQKNTNLKLAFTEDQRLKQ